MLKPLAPSIERCTINGRPYRDNPSNHPYDNKGRLIVRRK